MRKPFWKESHRAWYFQDGKTQVRLGGAESKQDQAAKEAAFLEYHRLMADGQPATSKTPAAVVVDQFLVWARDKRAEGTFIWYRRHCQSFIDFVGKSITVSALKPLHVTRWLDSVYGHTGPTNQNGACRAVARAFNWAAKQGIIPASPIAGMERPAAQSRDVFIDDKQWAMILGDVKPTDPFMDFLLFMDATGSRPQEARIIEASHYDRANERIILERIQSKGKKDKRVIRLNDAAIRIMDRLALKSPEGPVFRNKNGRPWRKDTIICRFAKLRKKLGIPGLTAYALRHRFCTRALLAGVDPLSVSILLGHRDTTMVMRVYAHLTGQDDFLKEKLRQATSA